MTRKRKAFPLVLIAAGLMGLGLYFVGDRFQWAIIPANDFGRGLWFGLCLGADLLGAMLLFKTRARITSGSSRPPL